MDTWSINGYCLKWWERYMSCACRLVIKFIFYSWLAIPVIQSSLECEKDKEHMHLDSHRWRYTASLAQSEYYGFYKTVVLKTVRCLAKPTTVVS